MGSSNKPATTTTHQTQTKTPWGVASQPLQNIVRGADALASDVSNFTPQYSNTTLAGIQGLENAAGQPGKGFGVLDSVLPGASAGFGTGLGTLGNVASGGMLNANAYLDPVIKAAIDDTTNKVNSQFTAAGRYGSGAHAGTLAKEVGNLDASMRLANYTNERAAQDAAAKTLYGGGFQGAGYAGAYDAANLTPAMLNLQAGGLRDQMLNAQRLAPMQALEWGSGIINPIAQAYGTSTTNQTQQTVQPKNGLTSALGYGMMGLGVLGAPFTGGASLGLLGSGLGMATGTGSNYGMTPQLGTSLYSGFGF